MVDFLIRSYGEDAFAELYATIKRGNRFDTALEEVYGFDLSGFEDEFQEIPWCRKLPPDCRPHSPPAERLEAGRPCNPPRSRNRCHVSLNGDDGISFALIIVIAAAMLFALMAVFFFLISQMMASGRADGGET